MSTKMNAVVVTVKCGNDSHQVPIDFTPSQVRAVNEAIEDLGGPDGVTCTVAPSTFFRPTRKRKSADVAQPDSADGSGNPLDD